ncbi:MAG: metalloregulator ArsR/SmtB family transcription factor [Candidatus Taylorbacteria bacterium]|nr:metalloregulator ArsR/SmtB family transcription factor [Candidatus Taylorbacteria bacterium]
MADHKKLERILKAAANRRRFNILAYLKKEHELTVGEISERLHLSFKSTSRHLSVLFAIDLVEKTQRGSEVFYRLGDNLHPTVLEVLKHV